MAGDEAVGWVDCGGCALELGGSARVSASAALLVMTNELIDTSVPPPQFIVFNRMGARRVPFSGTNAEFATAILDAPLHNVAVSSLDDRIDDLFKQPLNEFTRERNALMKTVRGADATRVRTLAKPSVVAWAANQIYWRARSVYERLMKSGERLRKAQIAALTGKSADLREANDAHRRAVADAVKEAERFAAEAGSRPAPDALMRTFEALSLANEPPAPPGRLSKPLQPAGFEALAGVTPKIQTGKVGGTKDGNEARRKAAEEKKHAAAERKRAAAMKKAEAAVERARQKMLAAQEALRRTREG